MTFLTKPLQVLKALALAFGVTASAYAQTTLSMTLAVDPTFNIDSNGNQIYTAAVTVRNLGGVQTSKIQALSFVRLRRWQNC